MAVPLLAIWFSGAAPSANAEDPQGDALVAGSVCEAQKLKAMQAEDPDLVIEIPPQYAGQWPSLAACESHDEAWSEDAPGPRQPIPFSHKHHAGDFGIDGQYCHSATDRSRSAGVPSVELCMGCHAQFPAAYDEMEGIRILKDHWGIKVEQNEDGRWVSGPRDPKQAKPIEWAQIHRVPEHVKFRHNRHVAAGVDCQTCHGPVEELDKLHLVPDTKWWFYGLPTQKLEMGWCIQCHRDNNHQASQDCLTCHY
ncbi:MAG: hypothetical protein MJE66_12850 [Proteobacteria bacterium]|nr:hypothetical protein [Pseudomonadota bacterium]